MAGGLSLSDGARVVALRSQAIRAALAGRGGMVSVNEPVDAVETRIGGWPGRLSVAAVNGPRATVVSGEPAALDELVAACEYDGVRARRIPVDYASHSSQVEELRERILADLAVIEPVSGRVPFYSTVTGEVIDTTELTAEYWFDNLRQTVRFGQVTHALAAQGFGVFVEVSAHPVLAVGIEDAVAVGTLRRGEGGWERFVASLGEAWVHGVPVEWAKVLPTGRQVDIPTYPFQRERFWLGSGGQPAAGGGLEATGHPLLGAWVGLAQSDGFLFTGRLSLAAQPWLADHAVNDVVLLPGTGLLELVLHAAHQSGCHSVEELTLETPLTLPERGEVQLQLELGAPDADGQREVTLHSRHVGDTETTDEWVRHASGVVGPVRRQPSDDLVDELAAAWPPPGAEPLSLDGLYERAAALGLRYGPLFQGVRAAWRIGDQIFAELELAEALQDEADAYGVHPALLDAALHATGLTPAAMASDSGRLPFSWRGVTLHAAGAASLRVRIVHGSDDSVSLLASDADGVPVVTVESLLTRPINAEHLNAARRAHDELPLHEVVWQPHPLAADAEVGSGGLALVRCGGGGGVGGDVVRGVVAEVLGRVQGWLGEGEGDGGPLVVVTVGAVAVGSDGGVADPAGSAVWGLVRSAQTEHPGRFVLVDTDDDEASQRVLPAAVATGEPQLAIRSGRVFVPRLERVTDSSDELLQLDPEGTVLVSGGLGTLGRLVVRRLVEVHGVRRLVLVGRRVDG
ncbi:acyltransferase domain-containing protein, partial [Streptomyces sp. 4N509B]|uniref:acyltransferase domain-containing protein n=1 Tax=Streptomyces sp. 4N509B TaxID=3457413 RepID=UPI003FD4EA29